MSVSIVAIVDDEITHYLTLQQFLYRLPVNIKTLYYSTANDLYTFLKKNAQTPQLLPDYIFLDIAMPDIDGWQFLDLYNEIAEEITKKSSIFINSSSKEHSEKALEHPLVKGFLTKPIAEKEVHEIFQQ